MNNFLVFYFSLQDFVTWFKGVRLSGCHPKIEIQGIESGRTGRLDTGKTG